jgi:HCOMODA/2-hydroxy-3-carboxy-muconic semialdehyde decarboxylase
MPELPPFPKSLDRRGLLASIVSAGAVAWLSTFPVRAAAVVDGDKDASDPDAQRIDDLLTCNHICWDLELVDGMGHPSVRSAKDPSHYYLAQSVAPGLVTKDDIIEFDQDSNPMDLRGRRIHGERFIHGEIYRARPDVQSIVHCHTPAVIPFGISGVPLTPVLHVGGFLVDGAPVFDVRNVADHGGYSGMLVRNRQLGSALAKTLGTSSVVLMRGHGMSVVGGDVPQATARAWYTYISARVMLQTQTLGRPAIRIRESEAIGRFMPQRQSRGSSAQDRNWLLWKARANARSAALLAELAKQ